MATVALVVAVISAVGGVFAVWYARESARTARRATDLTELALQLQLDERRLVDELHLIGGSRCSVLNTYERLVHRPDAVAGGGGDRSDRQPGLAQRGDDFLARWFGAIVRWLFLAAAVVGLVVPEVRSSVWTERSHLSELR